MKEVKAATDIIQVKDLGPALHIFSLGDSSLGFYEGANHTVSLQLFKTGHQIWLSMKLNGVVYLRKYKKLFASNKSYKKICAKFIDDVVNLAEMD